ncbi:MAG: hypothetical protein JW850_20735 [Thermoflexales bacterium]|nr:hypothetical protein [Thermoflexales bacterium]
MKRWMAAVLGALATAVLVLALSIPPLPAGAQGAATVGSEGGQTSPGVVDALRTRSALDAAATTSALGAAQRAASDQAAARAAAARAAQSAAIATQTAIASNAMLDMARQTVEAASLAATVQLQETQTALEVQAAQTRAAVEHQQTREAMKELARGRTATARADERNAAGTVAAVQATTTRQAVAAAYQQRSEDTVYGAAVLILLVIVVGTGYVGSRVAAALGAWANHLHPPPANPPAGSPVEVRGDSVGGAACGASLAGDGVVIDVSPHSQARSLAHRLSPRLPPVIVFNGPQAVQAIEHVLKDLPLDHSSEDVNPFADPASPAGVDGA